MKIVIEEINIDEEERIRKESGNLESLQRSIEEVGLINPILVDENKKLIAGFRRLSVCKNLGWKEIEATILEVGGDRMKMLDIEVAENLFRKDFTPEELLAAEKKRQEIIESLRKKSFFERFWLWLKALFTGKSTETSERFEPVEASVYKEKIIMEDPAEPKEEHGSEDEADTSEIQEPEKNVDEKHGGTTESQSADDKINIFSTTSDNVVDPYRK